MLQIFTDKDWSENFHMSRQMFTYLCEQLSSTLQKKNTVMRQSLSVEKRVVITLWCLATPTEYTTNSCMHRRLGYAGLIQGNSG